MKVSNNKNEKEKHELSACSSIAKAFETPKYMESILGVSNIAKAVEMPKYMESILGVSNMAKAFETPKYMESILGVSNMAKAVEMPKYMESALSASSSISKAFEKPNYIESALSASSSISKLLEKPSYIESTLSATSSIAKMLEKPNYIKSALSTTSSISKLFEKPSYIESTLSASSSISKLLETSKYAENMLGVRNNIVSELLKYNDMEKVFKNSNIIEEISKINFDSIKVNTNGTISYLDTTINISDEIIDSMNDINSGVNSEISYEERINSFLAKIKIKHPVVTFILVMFFFAPFYEYYLDCAKKAIDDTVKKIEVNYNNDNDKNKIIKDVKKEIITEMNLNYYGDKNFKKALGEYRVVKADCLNVRISDNKDSKVIYNLKFADVVKILKKNKNWTLIEYTVDEDVTITGWVYTRYISELK